MTVQEFEVHLELHDFIRAELLTGDWQAVVDCAKALSDGHTGRLVYHGPFFGFTIDTADYETRNIIRKRLLQGLDVCEAFGRTHMAVHSPFTTLDHNNLDNFPNRRERKIEACHQTMANAVKRAEDIGCELVIETIEDKDPYDRVRLTESFASKAVTMSIDTGHAHGTTGAPPVDYFVKAAGSQLRHVQLQDADGYADRHWTLGYGTINWHAVFEELGKLDSGPRLIIELWDASGIAGSIAHLSGLGLAQ